MNSTENNALTDKTGGAADADKNELRALTERLVFARTRLLTTHPFFGRLLLHLQIGYAECTTAFTDMKRIVFDPSFAKRLDEEELRFVFLHELMHCVLHHCTRGKTLRPYLYNVACDIVVNSLIIDSLGLKRYDIDGCSVMHLVPDGREGRLFSAEEVYEMLIKTPEKRIRELYGDGGPDTHIVWKNIADSAIDDEWDQNIREAAKHAGAASGIPYGLARYLAAVSHTPKTNWRQLLHDFIQYNRSDYSYLRPDRRFQGDVILPSFQDNEYGDKVEKLWFLIDTSGSIADEALAEACHEIKDALEQIENLSGELSFFDSQVSDPVAFGSVEELSNITPVGGGGTSFRAIFRKMTDHYDEELPTAVIILTDGYAEFPDEDDARGVPVMWIMIRTNVNAPWGECIHVD